MPHHEGSAGPGTRSPVIPQWPWALNALSNWQLSWAQRTGPYQRGGQLGPAFWAWKTELQEAGSCLRPAGCSGEAELGLRGPGAVSRELCDLVHEKQVQLVLRSCRHALGVW